MNFNEFIEKWNNKPANWDGAYGNQCVDLIRFYWNEVVDIYQPKAVNGAKDFWTNFEFDINLHENHSKISNTPDGIPQKGDIIIWGSQYGPWGHIAIFISGDVNSFTAFSQNDPTGTLCIKKDYRNYYGVLGWLRPNKNVNEAPSEPESNKMILDFLGVNNETEGIERLTQHLGEDNGKCDWGNASGDRGGYLGSERRKNDELVRQNGELEATVKSLEEQIRVLNDELENNSDDENIPNVEGFIANGLQIKTKTTYGEKIINYERK